jgi:ribosomal protein S18 acetylase RimI-like enzyme
MNVRRASAADLEQLVPMFEEYRAFYRCAPDEPAAREFLAKRLVRGDSVILIAVDEAPGAGAGFVQMYPTFSSLRMARALILNDLYVRAPYRRRGVARALMDAARAFAEESGAVALSLETSKDNVNARRLYESLGYELEHEGQIDRAISRQHAYRPPSRSCHSPSTVGKARRRRHDQSAGPLADRPPAWAC